MSASNEPIPDYLATSLQYAGIDPDRVIEWTIEGDTYVVRVSPKTELVNIAIKKVNIGE